VVSHSVTQTLQWCHTVSQCEAHLTVEAVLDSIHIQNMDVWDQDEGCSQQPTRIVLKLAEFL